METIHTDAAYRVFLSEDSSMGKIKNSLDQSVEQDMRRTLASSDAQRHSGDPISAVSSLNYFKKKGSDVKFFFWFLLSPESLIFELCC